MVKGLMCVRLHPHTAHKSLLILLLLYAIWCHFRCGFDRKLVLLLQQISEFPGAVDHQLQQQPPHWHFARQVATIAADTGTHDQCQQIQRVATC